MTSTPFQSWPSQNTLVKSKEDAALAGEEGWRAWRERCAAITLPPAAVHISTTASTMAAATGARPIAAGAVLPLLLACTTLHELVDRTSFLLALTNVHKGGSHSYDEIDTVLELTYTSGVEVRHFRATFLRCFRKQLRCRGDLRRIFDRYTEEKLLVRRDREEEEAARQREHQQEDKRHQIHSTSSSHRQGEYEKGGGLGGGRGGSGLCLWEANGKRHLGVRV